MADLLLTVASRAELKRLKDMGDTTVAEVVNVGTPVPAALADATANPTTVIVGAANELFNETTFDRQRGNTELTVFASAARTATPTPYDNALNVNARGLVLVIVVQLLSQLGSSSHAFGRRRLADRGQHLGERHRVLAGAEL
jgi:hypothetical protein